MCVIRDRYMALVWAICAFAALMTSAQAGPYEDALAKFTTDSFTDTTDGINGVTRSGNPLAETVIKALQDGRLFFSATSKGVYYKDASDKLFAEMRTSLIIFESFATISPMALSNCPVSSFAFDSTLTVRSPRARRCAALTA